MINHNDVKICESGLELTVKGMRYEISNGEELVLSGEISGQAIKDRTVREWCEVTMYEFISKHKINRGWLEERNTLKRVAWSDERKDYIQLQAIRNEESGVYTIQEFSSNEVFLRETAVDLRFPCEVETYMRRQYKIAAGLTAYVYRWGLGDCTMSGISEHAESLIILSEECPACSPKDISQCVVVQKMKTVGSCEPYIKAVPVQYPKRWYMAGGNFLHSSDSRFEEITGTGRPVPIHDRYEG